jgi:diguanylate cyclase
MRPAAPSEVSVARDPSPAAPVRRSARSTAWAWFLGIGVAGAACYPLVPAGLPQDGVYQAYGVASVVAILVGVSWYRPQHRWPWFLMAAGQGLWSLADAVGSVDADVLGNDRFPSPADPLYLLGYVVIGASLLALIRARGRGDVGGVLDSAIFTVAMGVLAWVLLAQPTIASYQESASAAAVGAAYPLFDIVLAGLLIRFVTTPGGRTRSFRLLVCAVLLLVAADTLATAFDMSAASDSVALEPLWLLSYAAWGAAALDRSMVSLAEPAPRRSASFSRLRLALLTAAVLVPPVILAVDRLGDGTIDTWVIVLGAGVLALLVMTRMSVAIGQIQAANRAREAAQDALAHQAAHDSLTGLPNRAQSMGLIRGALSRAQRSGSMIGLLFVDLDGFKQVNDTYGHGAGDEVLRTTGRRMQACVRTGDVVGRLGGDEFVVLLEPLDEEASAVTVAERVVTAVAEPLLLSTGRDVVIGASVGVAIAQDAQIDPDRLINEADVAVYRAKVAGRGRVEVFDRSLREELDRRAEMERALAAALRSADLTLRHEQIVDLGTGAVVGHEAQLAWPRAGADELVRSQVLVVAERTELICDLDAWVLREAAAQLAAVPAPDRASMLTVPIAGRHLLSPRLLDDVTAAFRDVDVDPSILVLLIHDTDLIDDPTVIGRLDQLRRLGVRICVDGFGANEGPTNRWGRLPVDLVRLDPVALTGGSSGSTMLLRLTVETAHTFNCRVIAGGVSDPELLPVLADAGCEYAQGPMSRRRRLAAVKARR